MYDAFSDIGKAVDSLALAKKQVLDEDPIRAMQYIREANQYIGEAYRQLQETIDGR